MRSHIPNLNTKIDARHVRFNCACIFIFYFNVQQYDAYLHTSFSNCSLPNHGYDISFSTWLWYLWCSLWLFAHGQNGTRRGAWHACPTTALTQG